MSVCDGSDVGAGSPRDGLLPTEKVAYWFFRLNGCLTIENFIVHPDFGDGVSGQRTEADLIGVRFPNRREDLTRPMKDHPALMVDRHRPLLFFAEVTLKQCKLNGPWTDVRRGNMQRVLRSVGMHTEDEISSVAEALYNKRQFSGSSSVVRMFALGDKSTGFASTYPGAVCLTWDEMLGFIFSRFEIYQRQKRRNSQWDDVGQHLYKLAVNGQDRRSFVDSTRLLLRNSNGDKLDPRSTGSA